MYARLEEDYGLARHAMHVYDRASKASCTATNASNTHALLQLCTVPLLCFNVVSRSSSTPSGPCSLMQCPLQAVPANQKFDIFCIYINRATDFFGLPKTREIYEASITTLPDAQEAHLTSTAMHC